MNTRNSIILLVAFVTSVGCNRSSDLKNNAENPNLPTENVFSDSSAKNQDKIRQIALQSEFSSNSIVVPKNEYLFIEIMENETAEKITPNLNAEYPYICIDFPMYNYTAENKKLESYEKNFMLEGVKLIVGKGIWLGENVGSGGSTQLYGVNKLPFYTDESAIYKIDSTNTVYLRHLDKFYQVNQDETLTDTIVYNVKSEDNLNDILRVTRTVQISNYGLLKKNDIHLSH